MHLKYVLLDPYAAATTTTFLKCLLNALHIFHNNVFEMISFEGFSQLNHIWIIVLLNHHIL